MSKEGSPYGAAFMIRMLVLLGILVLAVGGFYYDRQVLLPRAEKKIDEVQNLISARTDDGGGIPKSQVDEAIGNAATAVSREVSSKPSAEIQADPEKLKTFTPKNFEVVTYKFKRALPFMLEPYTLEVAYQDNVVVYSSPKEPIKQELLDSGFATKYKTVTPNSDMMPSLGGMGGGGAPRGAGGNNGGGDDESGDDESGDDESGDDESGDDEETKSDDESADDDSSEGEENKEGDKEADKKAEKEEGDQ